LEGEGVGVDKVVETIEGGPSDQRVGNRLRKGGNLGENRQMVRSRGGGSIEREREKARDKCPGTEENLTTKNFLSIR